jgi:hypothetical protein
MGGLHPDPRYKEILGRISFLEVYFRNSKVHDKKPSISGYGFLCQNCTKTHLQATGT